MFHEYVIFIDLYMYIVTRPCIYSCIEKYILVARARILNPYVQQYGNKRDGTFYNSESRLKLNFGSSMNEGLKRTRNCGEQSL